MSAIIKTLKTTTNDTEQSVYPKTVLEAVVDAETNETLDVILDNLNEKIDNIEPGGGGEIPTDVQEQIDGKVSKSGDTMTGTLNIDSPSFPALKLTRTGTTSGGNYTAIQFNNDSSMLGGLGMNTVSGDMVVMDKDGVGYPMLDKRNYNQYALPLTGGTVTGQVNVKNNVSIPLRADNTGDIMVTTPTAGTVNLSSTQGITDVLNIYKSFIGSIYAKNAWNNVISVRHRNGASDGNSHGMYLRSLMNNETPDLKWAVQAAGTWQGERTILDSGNYSSYALPLSGGKITGGLTVTDGFYSTGEQTVLYQDYYCFQCSDGAGKTGYWKLCTINVTGTYAGAIIEFDMTCRYGRGKLYLSFGGTSTDISAYTVSTFKQTGGLRQCYAVKTSGTSSGSVFDIYVQKEEAYGNLTVNHMKFPNYMRGLMTLTWSGAYASSVPTTNRSEAQVGNDWTTVLTSKGSTVVSLSLNKGSAYIINILTSTNMSYMLSAAPTSTSFIIDEIGGGGSATYSVSGTTLTITFSGGSSDFSTTCKYIELK